MNVANIFIFLDVFQISHEILGYNLDKNLDKPIWTDPTIIAHLVSKREREIQIYILKLGFLQGLERTSMAEKRPIDLFFYDQLNRMQDSLPIKLTVDCSKFDNYYSDTASSKANNCSDHLISPIEHCIRTKWNDAQIDWNGTDPLL